MQKSHRGWRLTVDYHGLNEVMPPLSAAMWDKLGLHYELEKGSEAVHHNRYCQIIFPYPFDSRVQATVCCPVMGCPIHLEQTAPGLEAQPSTPVSLWLTQTALEHGDDPEHLQYRDDTVVWGNTAKKAFEKGKGIIQIIQKAGFAINPKQGQRTCTGHPILRTKPARWTLSHPWGYNQ